MHVVVVLAPGTPVRQGKPIALYHGFASRKHAEDWATQAVPGYDWFVLTSIDVEEAGKSIK